MTSRCGTPDRKAGWPAPVVAAIALCGLTAYVRADAPPVAPEVLVARAASAYASLTYGHADEEQAISDLAAALRQDPADKQARNLLAAIQKRREERRRQQEQQGQQYLDDSGQGQTGQEGRPHDDGGDQSDRQQQQRDEGAHNRSDEESTSPGESEQPGQMSREQAERLLDALEDQEKRPTERPKRTGRAPRKPRW